MKIKIFISTLIAFGITIINGFTSSGQTCRKLWHPSLSNMTFTPNTFGCNNAGGSWDFTSELPDGAFGVHSVVVPEAQPCYDGEGAILDIPSAAGSIGGLGYRNYNLGVQFYRVDTIDANGPIVDTCLYDMVGYGFNGGYNNEGTYLTSAYTNSTLGMISGAIQALNNGTISFELHNFSGSCAPVSLFKLDDETNHYLYPPMAYSFLPTDTFKNLEPGKYELAIFTEAVNLTWNCGGDTDQFSNYPALFGPGFLTYTRIYEEYWPNAVYNLKMDTTLGTINYIPFQGVIVEAHESNDTSLIAETFTTDSLGRFGFANLDANTFYNLEFHYQDSLGVADSLYSSYEYLGYKPGDFAGDIYMPYTMLLQTKDFIKSMGDKGNYEMKYLLEMLDMDSIAPQKRKTYDLSKIDTLLYRWQNIDRVLAQDIVDNLGRVYLSLYANDRFADDAYRLSKIPPKAASEFVLMVMEIASTAKELKNLISESVYTGPKPQGTSVSQLDEMVVDAVKEALGLALDYSEYTLEKRLEEMPDGQEKEINKLWLKTIKLSGYAVKGIKDGVKDLLADQIKDILNDQMFIFLYERHMTETQSLIDETYTKADLLVPPGDNFDWAFYQTISYNYPSQSLLDTAREKTDLVLSACELLNDNADKADMVNSAGGVFEKLGEIAPELIGATQLQMKKFTVLLKKATLIIQSFKIINYGAEFYLSGLRYYQSQISQTKAPTLAFSPSAVFSNRLYTATSNTNYYGNDSIAINLYNNKLDSVIELIQNNQNAEAVTKAIELHQLDSVLNKAIVSSTNRIGAVANKAVNTVPDFDSLYNGFTQDLQNNFSFRTAMSLNLVIWALDTTTATTFIDTLIASATAAKLANQQVCNAIYFMDSITTDVSVAVRVMITDVETPHETEPDAQNDIKISYENFGTDAATNVYIKLAIDSNYALAQDSIYIGNVLAGAKGDVTFNVTSLLPDTFNVYFATLKTDNGEGDYASDYISTNKREICNGIDDNGNGIIDEGCAVTLNLHVFLEGLYSPGGTMSTLLKDQGISADLNAVDSITVELHDAQAPFDKAAEQSTILKSNGVAQLQFPVELLNGSYYIVVKHRNSIDTWSKVPVTIELNTTYDFTH